MNKIRIDLKIFSTGLNVFLGNKDDLNGVLNKMYGNKYKINDYITAITVYNDGKRPSLFITYEETLGVLSHEVIHCVNNIFHEKEIFYDLEYDEIFAYTVGYIIDEILNNEQINNEKFKRF